MRQRTIVFTDKHFHCTLTVYQRRHALQSLPLPQRVLEQLRVGLIPQQRHRQALRLPQRRGQNILLHPVEVGEPIHIHVLARQIIRCRQRIAQLLHPRPGIEPVAPQPCVVGAVDQRRRPQLFPGRAVHIRHLRHQLLRRHPVGIQLIGQRHQLPQKRRPLRGPCEHRQPPADLLQRPPHGQQLAAVVQRHVRQTAHLPQHPRGQVPEAQHLRVPAGGGAASAAQIQLRLMGCVLRHQQHLRPLPPPLFDGLQHQPALTGPGPAHPNLQFHAASLRASFFRGIIPYPLSKRKDISRPREKKSAPAGAPFPFTFRRIAAAAGRPGSPPSP